MEWPETIRVWNQTPIKVLDIRHFVMKPGEVLQSYRFPSSAFLFTNQGEAGVMLDGVEVSSAQFQVLHGGKGANVNIRCLNRRLDYYLVLYKPIDSSISPSAHRRGERHLPFGRRYAFEAKNPLALLSLLERMHQHWTCGDELDKLQATGLFYRFVHEQFRQLQIAETEDSAPDLAAQIAQYMHENYSKTISMETMASLFHYSTHYLSRVFKRKYGCSPIEYLIQTRMKRAQFLLSETDASIRDIAESVGYKDIYYFSRLFKKLTGATPAQFKMHRPGLKGSIRTNIMPESFIAPQAGEGYIVNKDNHYQQEAWRVNEMNISFKPAFAVALLFSLSLLLAACGGAGTETKEAAQGNNQPKNETVTDVKAETRTYKDDLGRQVEIPAQPKKAVIITYGGYLLPLGIKPLGVDQAVRDHYPDEMAEVESIGEGVGNVEAISALEPDIIILPDYFDTEVYATYEKIAPTVAVAWGGDPDVINTLRTIGDIMDRKQEAEAWIAKFEEKLQRIRDQIDIHIDPGATAITFILYKGEVLLGGVGGTLGKLIYKDYGFQMPEQFKKYADGGGVLSMEELANRPADYFFTQMTDEEMVHMTELFKEPLYQAIPAVKNNRIINVSRDKWNYGPILAEEAVDALIEQVALSQK
ncbi:AraC family transcriptional regulator [Paenibacillus sp. FJAT-27812]|uniref:AraC family transcriptional regulator n=1 Tax=Paenibacillus sp. FJAT-27812 TaxID=1684143 RepID=UPI0006A7E278|nr:ABC transporter substrate-binding protein [Paenibacillus sp. FJAT-27812]